MIKLPEGAPNLEEILIQSEKIAWREKSLKGIHEKMLWRNEETGASIALIMMSAMFAFCARSIPTLWVTCSTPSMILPFMAFLHL